MSSDLSICIDPEKLSGSGEQLSGLVNLADLGRLADLITQQTGDVRYDLTFARNEKGNITVTGEIESKLTLICQRCLCNMTIPVHSDVNIGIVEGENELAELEQELDPYQAEKRKISVLKLIEDEILLGLPISPMHEKVDCPAAESLQEYKTVKKNPFSVLETLKREKT
ncbi:MAG: hypothetical protein HKN08_06805 [Gammaproteobacteria bacterium]|nr:hypothetical protein [Gammaproteobacteria bacterium]